MFFLLILAILLEAFSSGTEIAFSSASRIRAYSRVREGGKRASLTLGFIEHPRRFLTTTLMGTNIGMVLASGITSMYAARTGITWLQPLLISLLTLFVLVFAEMIPKQMMLVSRESLVSMLSLPLLVLRVVLYPLIFIADSVSSLIVGRRTDYGLFESKNEILGLLSESSLEAGPVAERILRMTDTRVEGVMRSIREIPSVRTGEEKRHVLRKLVDAACPFVLVTERDMRTVRGYADGASLSSCGDRLDDAGVEGMPSFGSSEDLISVIAGLRKASAPAGMVLGRTGQPEGIAILDDIIDSLLGKTGIAPGTEVPESGRIEWIDGEAVIRRVRMDR